MEEKLVTLAILTYSKAQILKNVLENEGIEAYIHNVNLIQPVVSSGVRIRIKESDLPRALNIIESSAWLAEDIVKENLNEEENKKKNNFILIPVDFSDYSLKACMFGINFAGQIHADVVLMHIYFSPVYMPSLQYATEGYGMPVEAEMGIKSMLDNVHSRLKELTDTIDKLMAEEKLPKVKYTCLLREGVPEEEILYYAREEKPIMIVMGTRGEGVEEYGLLGSVTAEVIDRSPVFVYSIPEEAKLTNFKDINKVAFITNFDQRDLLAFDSLITTFKSYKFEIFFIHLNSDEGRRTWNEIKLSGIKEYFKKQYPELTINYSIIPEDHILNNLDEYVKQQNIDVLCISNYKRNVFARLFNPSIARKMIFHSRTPILVIK
ncbi:MAG: universal stress protein [Phocaeicola sp.]|nr:universal stress protein [Phocaeicola sp.]